MVRPRRLSLFLLFVVAEATAWQQFVASIDQNSMWPMVAILERAAQTILPILGCPQNDDLHPKRKGRFIFFQQRPLLSPCQFRRHFH